MSEGEARRKRIEEDNISTAELAGNRNPPAESVQGKVEEMPTLDVKPENQETREERQNATAVEVQRTDITPQVVPVQSVAGNMAVSPQAAETDRGPLFSPEEAGNLRSRWDAIQVGFVDEPRRSVQQADSLVVATMKRLAEQFAAERSNLESQWDRGGDISTEDLRIALRRYRSFFGRLLSV